MKLRLCALTFGAGIAMLGCSGIAGLSDELHQADSSVDGSAVPLDAGAPVAADATAHDDATVRLDAGSDATVDAAPCLPEGDLAFCARLGKNCGTVVASDNCGVPRTVASCGVCTSYYESCGGAWVDNVCGCTPESDWSFCTRLGRTCGALAGTDNCGLPRTVGACGGACSVDAGPPDAGMSDASTGAVTAETMATTARLTGPGLSDCGPNGNDVCARSLLVPGGTFFRGETTNYPATVSAFRLDKYEVTVGRFRKFVDAWVSGWRPVPGSGKHAHLNGGAGLVNTAGGFESGWDPTWNAYVGAPGENAPAPSGAGATTKAAWDASLSGAGASWTPAPGENERKPIVFLSPYDLRAFCIWDGAFLPSEAEWEFVAAAGSEKRIYPWGDSRPAADTFLAIYGCYFNGPPAPGTPCGVANLAPVGSAPAGVSRTGQLDLAGNALESVLDWHYASYTIPCNDCAALASSTYGVMRGGSYIYGESDLRSSDRQLVAPASRPGYLSGRCARTPSGGTCTAETDASFCARFGASCGSKSGTDNCGHTRTVANCGTCGSSTTCGPDNRCRADELTCSAGTLPGGGSCQACGLSTCSAPTCDDGMNAAASLPESALECHYRASTSTWNTAVEYCLGLGSGWRLPTKGEAMRISGLGNLCRSPVAAFAGTWTLTCAGAGAAWLAASGTNPTPIDRLGSAVCVR